MPAADELEAERVPELVSTLRDSIEAFRYRRLGPPIGGPEATLRGQRAVLALAVLVVFACFFAIGSLTKSGGSSGAGAPATLEGAAPHAAVPVGLNGGSPIAGAVPVAIVAKPRPRVRRQAAQALPTVVSSGGVATAPPATTVVAEPVPAEGPASASAPSSSQRAQSPAPRSGANGGSGGSGSAGSGSSSAGEPPAGGSFDSSE